MPTEAQLAEYARMVNYEIGCLFDTYSVRSKWFSNPAAPYCLGLWNITLDQDERGNNEIRVVTNSLLEAWLIHVRNLYGFFWGDRKKARETDLFAEAFLVSPATALRGAPGVISQHIDRIHKTLAHISTKRSGLLLREGWPMAEITKALWESLREFKGYLPEARQSWFQAVPKKWDPTWDSHP